MKTALWVSLRLSSEEALVLLDAVKGMVDGSTGAGGNGDARVSDAEAAGVLRVLARQMERVLPGPSSPEYAGLVREARERLRWRMMFNPRRGGASEGSEEGLVGAAAPSTASR